MRKIVLLLATIGLLSACNILSRNNNRTAWHHTTKAFSQARLDTTPSFSKEMGDGKVYIFHQKKDRKGEEELKLQTNDNFSHKTIYISVENVDADALTYIYIDGVLEKTEHLGPKQTTLELKERELSIGNHTINFVQFDNQALNGSISMNKIAKYSVFHSVTPSESPKSSSSSQNISSEKNKEASTENSRVSIQETENTPPTISETTTSFSFGNGSTSEKEGSLQKENNQKREDGFNFSSYHFDLSNFEGSGHVPQKTPYVYQWTTDPSHYLFEKDSIAGEAVWQIAVGDIVTINGTHYTVFKIDNGLTNDETLYDHVKSQEAQATWQTCDTSVDNSTLTIWYAR